MSDNQQMVSLLMEFDQAISWPDAHSVTSKALAFFDNSLELERISITLDDPQDASFVIYTNDTSIPQLSTGEKHSQHPRNTQVKPRYFKRLIEIKNPTDVTEHLKRGGIQSYFEVPLIIGEQVFGSLEVGSRREDGIPLDTQEIITLLSTRLSLALFHARLHDDLKQKEADLAASEKSQRELIDQAADTILRAKADGQIIQANLAATRLLGYSSDELLQMNLSDLFEPDILVRKPLRYDLMNQGMTVLAERIFRTKGGDQVPIEMNSRKLSDGTLVSIVRDLSERNITNEKLLDQKNQINAIFDATPTPMYAKDQEGRYTMLNDAYLDFFGKTREEMLGKTVTEVWNSNTSRQVAREDLKLLSNNDRQYYASEYLHSSGKMHQVLLRKSRYLNSQGKPAGFVGTLLDYTELKAAEDRYETLFNHSPNPVVVHDGQVILTANQAAIDFFKTDDPDKYRNSPISEFIHPSSIENSQQRITDLLNSKVPNELTNQKFIIATGEVRDVEVMAVPIDYQGEVVIMTSFRDVTNELGTRQALEASEDRYRRVFTYSPTAMVLHDNGVLLDANQAALDFAGAKSLDEILGIDLFTMVHPDFIDATREGLENLLKTKRPLQGVREHKFLTLAGEERWVEISGVTVSQAGKTLILLSFNDIHDRVTARELLEKSRQELEVITGHLTSYLFLVGLDLSLRYVNQATARLMRRESSELVGISVKDVIPLDQVEVGLTFLPELMKGKVCNFSHHYVSENWGEIDFTITLIPVKEDDGEVRAILVQMDDVTEIESARQEISENKELLELIVDTIPGLFSYSDMNEKYLYVNQAYANWYGYDKTEVIGKTFADIVPDEIYQDFKPHLLKVPDGENSNYSQILNGPDGRDHIMDIRNIPHFDKQDRPKAFLTSIQDVTERQEHENFREALRRLARQLTVSLEPRQVALIAASLLHDLYGYDAFAFYKIDLEAQEAVGLLAQDTFLKEDKLVEVATDVNTLDPENKTGIFLLSTPLLINREAETSEPTPETPFGDATRKSLSLVFVPVFWEGAQIGLFTLQSYVPGKFQDQDLPKLKIIANQIGGALVRAESDALIQKQTRELKEREGQLQLSVKEKDVLLKEVYHRTKNNMQVIVGLLEMQGLKTQNPEIQTMITEMTNRIYSMSIVHDLLYRSRNLAEIMLDDYLQKLIERLTTAYKTTQREIEIETRLDTLPVSLQTAIPLGLVINEIVTNSLKYAFPGDRGGKIILSTKIREEGGLTIEIGDNGKGLSESSDFSKPDTLGMYIIREIVDLQLLGSIEMFTDDGVKYLITIPNLKLD